MPKLIIDHLPIEVPEGTKVIAAAEKLGIVIPRFCYHPGLGSFGACRMCAVKFLEGPVKGVEMSCMTVAQDGMVVSTTDPEAQEFRRYVIEWLMLNHPLDCPVCDEGGHCQLQDETVSGGHGLRRYLGKKRTYEDQYLGVFVRHEMNRCIHCWRCRNFYQGFAGYRDLGAMQIGNRMYFGRYQSGGLQSPFAGNLIDVCPTGVFTDKPARYKGRRWDFERAPSICLHCSLGCNTVASARYREIMRQEGRFNDVVNGYFICDRGRFGFDYANHPQRPRRARVAEQEVPVPEALEAAAIRLIDITARFGPEAVACCGSERSSLETQGWLRRLCRLQGWPSPRFLLDPVRAAKVKTAVGRFDERLAVSLRDLEEADFILVVGADPINEAPMLALALRQAWRRGARVAVLDPRPVFLPLEFEHLPLSPGNVELSLHNLIKLAVSPEAVAKLKPECRNFYAGLSSASLKSPCQEQLAALAGQLSRSKKPVVVCGTELMVESTISLAAAGVQFLHEALGQCGFFYLLPGPNSFGAALMEALNADTLSIDSLASLETGSIKALVLVENDLFRLHGQEDRLTQALDNLELLIVLDYLPTPSAQRAQIFLPTQTVFEGEEVFVNQEGRFQTAAKVYEGGTPISQVSPASHPPRLFSRDIPGGESKAARELLQELGLRLGIKKEELQVDIWEWLAGQNPMWGRGQSPKAPGGVRLIPVCAPEINLGSEVPTRQDQEVLGGHLQLYLVDWTFGTEELSAYSRFTIEAETSPYLSMHQDDAHKLRLKDGDRVALHLPGGVLEVDLRLFAKMAPGVLLLPRHRQLPWPKLPQAPLLVPVSALERR